jgi:hypothetical protein
MFHGAAEAVPLSKTFFAGIDDVGESSWGVEKRPGAEAPFYFLVVSGA